MALCDSPQSCATVLPLHLATAQRLVELIDRAAEVKPAGRQLIGSLPTAEGRALHVLRASWHLVVHDDPEPLAHSGWTLRYADQVNELRAARRCRRPEPLEQSTRIDRVAALLAD